MYTTRVLPLVVILASFHCNGFRIRRSGIAGFNDPYALSNAYSDMDRRRRRTGYGPLDLNGDDSYFSPNSLSDVDDSDSYLMGSPYRDDDDNAPVYFPDYRFKSSYPPYRNMQEDNYPYGDLEEPVYTPQKRMSHTSHAYKRMGTSSMNELRKIFASAEVPEKKLAPVKRREPSIKHGVPNKRPSTVEQTKDLVNKVREILAAAERITRAQAEEEEDEQVENNEEPKVVKDVVTEAVSPDGKTVEKQEEIITTTGNGGVITEVSTTEESADDGSDDDENVPEILNEQEMPDDGEDQERALSKSKRASSKYDSEGYVSDLEEEVENLRGEVVRLQLLQILEDKENDYLANALKFATLDQLENDDRLVVKEYDDINKATETEELIQQISNGNDDEDEGDVTEEYLGDNSDNDDEVMKRADLTPDADGWIDGLVQESVDFGGPANGNVDDGSEYSNNVPYSDEAMADEEGEDEDEDGENEAIEEMAAVVNQELERESEKQEQKQVLQGLLKGLNTDEIEDLITELKDENQRSQEEEKEDSFTDVCLPVLELSQNCAFADSLGIPVDQEARDLCSRHQLCYTCGATHGISQLGCNDGYKGEVIDACKDDDNCIRQSAIFLRLMERYHKFESYSPDECRAQCVEDYILGEE